MKIEDTQIGLGFPPYVIAEVSANHRGKISEAKKLIELAKENGANAVKLQTYSADTMTLDSDKPDFRIQHGLWKGRTLYQLYESAQTPFEWQQELFKHAKDVNITIFSTPFDNSAVNLLDKIGTPAFKISSFEITDIPLIEHIAKKNKPILMSTGMANETEVNEAFKAIKKTGVNDLMLLHCVSAYPAKLSRSNLKMIPYLRERFNVPVGLSDHTLGNEAAVAAITMGAVAVEKHFISERAKGGEDSSFSIEPKELRSLVDTLASVWESLSGDIWARDGEEILNTQLRRSLYFVKALERGQEITEDSVKSIRPGFGLPPKYLKDIVGKYVSKRVEAGDRVEWASIS